MNRFPTALLHRDLSRRAFLRSALISTGSFSLPHILQWQALAASTSSTTKKRSLIVLWQDGGASHIETFDPKPDAPSEYRGELGAISTSLAGVCFCEVLPSLARLANRICVIRSLHQPSSDHVIGSHNVLTGWYDETEGTKSRYPDFGAVISRMRSGMEAAEIAIGASTDPRLAKGMRGAGSIKTAYGESAALPSYIDVSHGLHRGGPAFLGPINGPFQVAGDPSKPGFVIQNLNAVSDVDRLRMRNELLAQLDHSEYRQTSAVGFEHLQAIDSFRQQAMELLSGGAAARAFDLSRERNAVRERYGYHLAGQQCLLARRLIEAGVSVVAIRFSPDGRGDYDQSMIGWDDHAVHGNIFHIMRQRGPQFDQSVSALIEDLDERGMADDVLLLVFGEFGRTPRIHVHKGCPGREHWGPAGCALLYGGGLAMGQVVGSTNDKGEHPQDRPLTYQSLLATIYHAVGIDPHHTFINQAGRPVPILPAGETIAELTTFTRRTDAERLIISNSLDSTITLRSQANNNDLAAIASHPKLTSLTLHDTQIDDDGLAVLASCYSLRSLQLNGTPITDAGLRHLSQLSALEELNLSGTRTTAAGLAHLKSLLHLRRLAFNGTSISLAEVVRFFVHDQNRSLIEALAAMGLVTFDAHGDPASIDVANTSFSDNELQYIGSQPALRELHLAATQVTDVGMVHLEQLTNLEQLYLAKCNVGDSGLEHVAGLSQLRVLNLYGTKLTSTGLVHLSNLKQLRSLLITDIKLRTDAVDALKRKLPRLSVTDYTPV